jgi:hypothetical protein
VTTPEPETPPVGEEIHLPGPTALPVVCAAAVTMIVIGTTIGPDFIISIVGLIVFLITVVKWVRDTRRDIDELPEEHVHR